MPTRRINSTRIDSKRLELLEDAALALRELVKVWELGASYPNTASTDAIRILNGLNLGMEPLPRHKEYKLAEIQELSVGRFFRERREKLDCVNNYVITPSARPGVGCVIWGFNVVTRRMDHLGDSPSAAIAADACRKAGLYPNDRTGATLQLRRIMDGIASELRD